MVYKLAPIVLFTYNRPFHTKNVLDSLAANEKAADSILYVFCDGAKEGASEEVLKKIDAVRKIVTSEKRFKEVIVTLQPNNKGLANSIINGVTTVIKEHGRAIVLEDDLQFSPFFLDYMNDALTRYKDNKNVGHIGSCNFFACGSRFPDSFFTIMPDTWGWATWNDRWEAFNSDAVFLFKELEKRDLMHTFNTYGAYNMKQMLVDQIFGKVDSWAIRWQAVMVLNNWLCLYPNPSYSHHIESSEATHAKINLVPPMQMEKPSFKTVDAVEDALTTAAMMRGYAGKGDYYGKYKSKFIFKTIRKFIKKGLLFLVPHGLVMVFKKNKKDKI